MQSRPIPFGAELTAEGVRFSLWAPDAERVALVVDAADPFPVERDADGFARVVTPGVSAGARYSWLINDETPIPDPASRFQPDGVFGPSLVVDPAAFAWRQSDWRGRPWEEAVIYEVHVGTATNEGTYDGLRERLDALRDLGVTMIELMPIAETPGSRNWGYDGVLPYAPNEAYGSPDDLKRLIDSAHERGIMVMLDVVYNHFGPSGNYLPLYARSFFTQARQTPWGAAIDFDASHRRAVRDFVICNALYWLDEYQFDGLRLDAVHAIADDSPQHILGELSERAKAAFPDRHIHLVLENEHNSAYWLARDDAGQPRFYSAQWNDDIHHCWHVLLTGESEAYYEDFAQAPLNQLGRCLAEGFAYQGEASPHAGGKLRGERSAHLPPQAFISFLQNHDQVGNRAFGDRLSSLTEPHKLALAHAVLILGPQIPMLFMGEDWSASTPFQFFVDFGDDPDLSAAVRDGRRREFARFSAFSAEEHASSIPDPTDVATFNASTLRWEERMRTPHAQKLQEMRELIALRQTHVTPLLRSGFEGADHVFQNDEGLDVHWRFAAGDLRLFLQFNNTRHVPLDARQRVIWSSAEARDGGYELAPWTGLVTLEARHAGA
ncbi:MAG: malto-oligosyltrehalose trehalohydrolase [Hyphomicrobiales bacterium]|nr:malto-oligosyltrehalose trehalohydrolase [Hyphomicrobiales bacterium]